MDLDKRKYFKIGDYIYDSKRNFHWFKIIDRKFYTILKLLKRFHHILYIYNKNILRYKHKYFNHKDYKKNKKK